MCSSDLQTIKGLIAALMDVADSHPTFRTSFPAPFPPSHRCPFESHLQPCAAQICRQWKAWLQHLDHHERIWTFLRSPPCWLPQTPSLKGSRSVPHFRITTKFWQGSPRRLPFPAPRPSPHQHQGPAASGKCRMARGCSRRITDSPASTVSSCCSRPKCMAFRPWLDCAWL